MSFANGAQTLKTLREHAFLVGLRTHPGSRRQRRT